MKLVLASGNAGKLAELRDLLGNGFIPARAVRVRRRRCRRDRPSFIENAILKARHAARATGLPRWATIPAVRGCIARRARPVLYPLRRHPRRHRDANIDKLLRESTASTTRRAPARFVCVLALVRHADDPMPLVAEGAGKAHPVRRRGGNGFGYDPVFFSPLHGCSAGGTAGRGEEPRQPSRAGVAGTSAAHQEPRRHCCPAA